MSTPKQRPLLQPLAGMVQVGANGKDNRVSKMCVPTDEMRGLVAISLYGEGRPVYLTLARGQALRLAAEILRHYPEREGETIGGFLDDQERHAQEMI
jgi:hypothetical protein